MSQTQIEHTKTPWSISSGFMIVSEEPIIIASCLNVNEDMIGPPMMESEANARHIVKCVNSHDELVKALQIAMARFPMNKETNDEFDKCIKALATAQKEG